MNIDFLSLPVVYFPIYYAFEFSNVAYMHITHIETILDATLVTSVRL